ncbi:MAG: SDR family oxidoreductase [Actinobacteria bacterium]|nr:SDR family oxidoreductase [Actinomycetota bacterium]
MADGLTVVVTGASAGVGRAVVQAFAAEGANVAALARGRDGLDGAAKDVAAQGGRALALDADVADASAVDHAAEEVERELGPIDVWVNNAMTSVFAPVHELSADEVRRVTEVTYLGAVNGTLAALARMRPRDAGTIVQVGSALAYRAIPLQAAYCGAKHAMKGFTESLRCELLHEHSGVRVSMVQMPALNTPQFDWVRSRLPRQPQPVPPIYQPEVAAQAVLYAAEHAPKELWVGGSTVATILGNRVIPRLLDRYLARTGFDSQQTDQPVAPDRQDNLCAPVAGDHGSHGRFDQRSHPRSLQLRARMALGALTTSTLGKSAKTSTRSRTRRNA